MATCYVCRTNIGPENESEEHLLLNSIGGNLTSKTLICSGCNSSFGEDIDTEFSKQLNPIANMLNIKRDRGVPQPFRGIFSESGQEVSFSPGGKPMFIKPEIDVAPGENNTYHFRIKAKDQKQAIQVLNGLKRKHPQIDVEKVLKESKIERGYTEGEFEFGITIGGDKAFRAVCKTAVNFFIHFGGESEEVAHLISYIQTGDDRNIVGFYYPTQEVIQKNANEIFHSIVIEGNPSEKVLYAYIEFFNAFRFIVLLNDNYQGPCKYFSYCFNVMSRSKAICGVKLNLSRHQIEYHLDVNRNNHKEQLINEHRKLLQIIMKKKNKEFRNEMIKRGVEKFFGKYPEVEIITEEMIKELVDSVMEELSPWLKRNF